MRLCKLRRNFIEQKLAVCFTVMCCFYTDASAQHDTTIVDTVSFSKIDSLTAPDDNDAYADTTIKHIYDTSQYFFNWKANSNQPYVKTKIIQRNLIDNDVKALKSNKDFWYIPAVEKIEARLKTDTAYRDSLLKASMHDINNNVQKDFRLQPWVHFLTWFIIIGIFLGAIIYFLSQQKISFFMRQSTSSNNYVNDETNDNIFQLSYNDLLRKAEQEQNYRVAVRLFFLQTLKVLSETNHIKYQPDYTNFHYLQQLHQSNLYNDFAALTRNYEYIWYGKFELQQELYKSIKNNFLMFQYKIT